jgi:hypothetical protein
MKTQLGYTSLAAALVIGVWAFAYAQTPNMPLQPVLPLPPSQRVLNNQTMINASSGLVAAGTANATITNPGNLQVFVTGAEITATNSTAGGFITCTIGPLFGPTISIIVNNVTTGATIQGPAPIALTFNPPQPAPNGMSPVLSCPAFTGGGGNVAVNLHGFIQ